MQHQKTPDTKSGPAPEPDFMNVDSTDFSRLRRPEQIRQLEVEGFLVFPEILDSKLLETLKSELADAEMTHTSYSVHQSRSLAPDIAKPFLQSLNTTGFEWHQPHKPPGMKTDAPGINPSRWER